MEETIRFKLKKIPGVALLRLPEWPFEEPHVGKTECCRTRCDSWLDNSDWRQRVVSSH
jgi:hypothetical protein